MKPVRFIRRSGFRLTQFSGGQRSESRGRAGATLTEVLMATLIMGVGVISVFTLFPISVLRTVQATQQTNSKIHKLNTVELVKTFPGLLTLYEPGIAPFNYQGQAWQPNAVYNNGTRIVPTIKPLQTIPSPLFFYEATQVGTDPNGDGYRSGIDEPAWNTQSVVDGDVRWDPVVVSYVVDPLGYHIANADGTSPINGFGNKTDSVTGIGVTPPGGSLARIHGGINSTVSVQAAVAVATSDVALADSWEQIVTGTPSVANNSAVTFPTTISLTGAGGPIRRLVATSTDGQMTVYRSISNIAGQVVNLSESFPTRFPGFAANSPDIGTARIESLTRRYTWFLTVRNSPQGQPDIKCVVVFNRNFGSASEHVYDANFGGAGLDIDGASGADGAQHGLTSSAWVKIAWPSTEPAPLLKPGNWVFDARDVTWYRIQDLYEQGTAGGVNYAVLILDRNVRRQSTGTPIGQAMLMPGIIEVFNM